MKTTLEIVNDCETQAQVNQEYLAQDESHLWPIRGRFNVTKRAIGRLKRAQAQGLVIDDLYAYALSLEAEMSEIVNNERNW